MSSATAAHSGPAGDVVLEVDDVRKSYRRGPEEVNALRGVGFTMRRGEVGVLIGPSGSGKTTLLNILCGWEHADAGQVRWPGVDGGVVWAARPGDRVRTNRRPWADVSMLPQQLGLLDELSVRDNVELPLRLGEARSSIRPDGPGARRVDGLLRSLGLEQLADRRPPEISIGEQQRTALARSLVLLPGFLLGDEPTGHQDERWGHAVLRVIRAVARRGSTCLVATHNRDALRYADLVFAIGTGRCAAFRSSLARSEDLPQPSPSSRRASSTARTNVGYG